MSHRQYQGNELSNLGFGRLSTFLSLVHGCQSSRVNKLNPTSSKLLLSFQIYSHLSSACGAEQPAWACSPCCGRSSQPSSQPVPPSVYRYWCWPHFENLSHTFSFEIVMPEISEGNDINCPPEQNIPDRHCSKLRKREPASARESALSRTATKSIFLR